MIDEKQLRVEIEKEIERLTEAIKDQSKDTFRELHRPAVANEISKGQPWIRGKFTKYKKYFANGSDINPEDIQPVLLEVKEEWQKDLFRIARYTWSLPYTKGYGRRLRFLILDNKNGKLIGVFGLQSPPLDFPARDKLFSYPKGKKVGLVNQTMDIYTLGAIPPYNSLLAGKLVALAVTSNEVRTAYQNKYATTLTEMNKENIPANLICLTTTSAFGRSSIYNRLKIHETEIAKSIGYTEGYGSFHLSPLYPLIREYLESKGISTKGGFGVGPRIVWQTYVRAQKQLGLPKDILKHGIKREVFLFSLTNNLTDYMEGRSFTPEYIDRPFPMLTNWWKERWLCKRASKSNGWHDWNSDEIEKMIILETNNDR